MRNYTLEPEHNQLSKFNQTSKVGFNDANQIYQKLLKIQVKANQTSQQDYQKKATYELINK